MAARPAGAAGNSPGDRPRKQHLIACPIFARELAAVLGQAGAGATVHFLDYMVHNRPETMERELARAISSARADGAAISLLVGRECQALQPLAAIAGACGGVLPEGHNCLEIILGRERARALQENRTTVMTPAWIEMINKSIADHFWTVADARINLGWYDKILLLDSGLEPLDEAMIMAFFELTQVPIEIMPVALDHFQKVVRQLLAAR